MILVRRTLISTIISLMGLLPLQTVCAQPDDMDAPVPTVAQLPLPPSPANNGDSPSESATPSEEPSTDTMPLRPASGNVSGRGQLQLEAEDPLTGNVLHIDVSSDELEYDMESETYRVKGEVYIIIPERNVEILANEAEFDFKRSSLVAFGNVFIFNKDNVSGSSQAKYDFERKVLYQKDFRTVTPDFQAKADLSERYERFHVLTNGRFVVNTQNLVLRPRYRWFRVGDGASFSFYTARLKYLYFNGQINNLLVGTTTNLSDPNGHVQPMIDESGQIQINVAQKPISPRDVANARFDLPDNQYHVRVKSVNIHRKGQGIDVVKLTHPRIFRGGIPLWYMPYAKFGRRTEEGVISYLGPDFGYNIDHGGLFGGPSISAPIFKGFGWVSPILTYGSGRQTSVNQTPRLVDSRLGAGVLAHYRSHSNSSDFGWNSTNRAFNVLSTTRLFGRSDTRFRLAYNRYYTNGFNGVERPNLAAELTQYNQAFPIKNVMLRTYATAGLVRDEFFPTGRRVFFVAPTSLEPITTSRVQLQTQLLNIRPLININNDIGLGFLNLNRFVYYGTGDLFMVLRAGPTMTFAKGPLFSQTSYLYTTTSGSTPLVFDSYFEGQNTVQTVNAIDIGKKITVGALHILNLDQNNARRDLLVGNQFFISFGPSSLKFSLGYDMIQKRSLFGLTINPDGGQAFMDFDTINIFQPGYNAQTDRRLPVTWGVVAPASPPPAKTTKKRAAASAS